MKNNFKFLIISALLCNVSNLHSCDSDDSNDDIYAAARRAVLNERSSVVTLNSSPAAATTTLSLKVCNKDAKEQRLMQEAKVQRLANREQARQLKTRWDKLRLINEQARANFFASTTPIILAVPNNSSQPAASATTTSTNKLYDHLGFITDSDCPKSQESPGQSHSQPTTPLFYQTKESWHPVEGIPGAWERKYHQEVDPYHLKASGINCSQPGAGTVVAPLKIAMHDQITPAKIVYNNSRNASPAASRPATPLAIPGICTRSLWVQDAVIAIGEKYKLSNSK